MCQSGAKCAADAAQEGLKYFFKKVVAKSDELQRLIIKYFKRKETNLILIVFDALDSDTRSY
jgi:hypothetical protein